MLLLTANIASFLAPRLDFCQPNTSWAARVPVVCGNVNHKPSQCSAVAEQTMERQEMKLQKTATGAWCCSAVCQAELQRETNQSPAGGASERLAAVRRRLVGHVGVRIPFHLTGRPALSSVPCRSRSVSPVVSGLSAARKSCCCFSNKTGEFVTKRTGMRDEE